jgi:hypothetical protein
VDIHAILTRAPINKLAASVIARRRESGPEAPLTREELSYLMQHAARKQQLLKRVLGIHNDRQHKNVTYRAAKGMKQFRAQSPALAEYLALGQTIHRFTLELSELRKQRRQEAQLTPEEQALAKQRRRERIFRRGQAFIDVAKERLPEEQFRSFMEEAMRRADPEEGPAA